MYPRVEYEMTEADFEKILNASRPTPCIMVGNYCSPSPQENANAAWSELGRKMGFDYMTVRPIQGKGERFFTAVPTETLGQREERERREVNEKLEAEIFRLNIEISDRQERLGELLRAKSGVVASD
jgi:hypothetical protein